MRVAYVYISNGVIYSLHMYTYVYICLSFYINSHMSIQTQELIEMKFIAKVSAMGPRRFMVEIPKERFNEAKELKGKHVFVMLKEIIVDEAFDKE